MRRMKTVQEFKRDERGMTPGYVIGLIVSVMVASIGLAIAAVVTFETTGAIDTTSGSHAENAIEDIESNTASGFSIGSLLPLVIFGVGMIGLIITAFAMGRGR